MDLDVCAEFGGIELGDLRLERRAMHIVQRLSARPAHSFPKAFTSDAEREGLYRFVQNSGVTFEALISPHTRESVARCTQHDTVLVAHDTTDFTFKGEGRKGLGKVSNSSHSGQAFYGHFSVAISADGSREPLGTLAVERWARTGPTVSGRRKAGELSKADVRKEKRESGRWLEGVQQVEKTLKESSATPIHLMDSEADDFELFCRLIAQSHHFVVRGHHDRKLAEPVLGARTIKAFVAALPIVFEMYTPISKRKMQQISDRKRQKGRPPRVAQLAFSSSTVCLKRPRHVEEELPPDIQLNVVHVREIHPPEGQEPVDWTLFTTEPVDTDTAITRVVDFYRARWVIEEFFKALKTGCGFEKRQLESLHTLQNALALFLPIAWGLLRLRTLARDYPHLPATRSLQPLEITVLRRMGLIRAENALPTMREALLAIAKLGGFIKWNGEPGWLILGRGYQELIAMVAGFKLARKRSDQS